MAKLGFFCNFILPTIIGQLDVFTDILYILFQSFYRNDLFLACFYCQFTLFFGGLLFYIYVHLKDVSSHNLSIFRIIIRSFELTILTELKLAHFSPRIWDLDEDPEFEFNDNFKEKIVSIQEVFHTMLQAIPQIIIQTLNNTLLDQWNGLSIVSLGFSGFFLAKIGYKIILGCFFKEKNRLSEGLYMEI
jgi:hypothetical protein